MNKYCTPSKCSCTALRHIADPPRDKPRAIMAVKFLDTSFGFCGYATLNYTAPIALEYMSSSSLPRIRQCPSFCQTNLDEHHNPPYSIPELEKEVRQDVQLASPGRFAGQISDPSLAVLNLTPQNRLKDDEVVRCPRSHGTLQFISCSSA